MAFIQYTMQVIMAFLMITMVSILLPRASVFPDHQRSFECEPLFRSRKTQPIKQSERGVVEFRDVCFITLAAMRMSKISALSPVRDRQPPLSASTGSGKSTLINPIPASTMQLAARFWWAVWMCASKNFRTCASASALCRKKGSCSRGNNRIQHQIFG